MHNIKSMAITLGCAGIVLGMGYLGIVESGRRVLKSESAPEQAEYENVGSNIFYGKIEDDIEIFPWNYYPHANIEAPKNVPIFLEEEFFMEMYQETYGIEELSSVKATDWYFGQLIAYEAGVALEDVLDWFDESNHHILQNMVKVTGSSVGDIFFYQDILKLGGLQYQVRIACSNWNVISFICTAYHTKDQRNEAGWKRGKEKMVEVLEESEISLSKFSAYMTQLYYMVTPSIYLVDGNYENSYLQSFRWLECIMQKRPEESMLLEEMKKQKQDWEGFFWKDECMITGGNEEEENVENVVHYSYQVVELKDMILLLMQGDKTLGFYYDPISQKFCGYNYFYES